MVLKQLSIHEKEKEKVEGHVLRGEQDKEKTENRYKTKCKSYNRKSPTRKHGKYF